MCLAKVYIGSTGENQPLMQEVTSVKVDDGKLVLTSLFGEQKEISASIKEIDFKGSNIILESGG